MYGDQVFTKKSSHAGVISQTRNYVMYEDVDELEKYRKIRQPVLREPRPEPFYDPLDNYRYYEDLTLRDKRKRSLVKHERTSEPVGRETPFLRDSFKKHVVNYVPSSNTQRSYSNERSNRRQSPRPELRQRPRPGTRYEYRQSPRQGPRPGPFSNKQYYHKNHITFSPKQKGCVRENHPILRQLRAGPQRSQNNFYPKNTQVKGRRGEVYDCYDFDGNDDFNYDYTFKQSSYIRKPKRESSYRRRNEGSSYEKKYRNAPRFDCGCSCANTSSSLYRYHKYN
jgi:hypothetical protein